MPNDKIPCCAADALFRIRKISVNGVMTGITGLDECIAAVAGENLSGNAAIRAALLKRIQACNYIPPGTTDAYADALLLEYTRVTKKQEEKTG